MGAITLPLCRWASRGPEKAQDVLLSDGVTIFIYRLSFSYMGASRVLYWIRYLKRSTGHYPIALKGSWVLFGRTLQARSLVRWNTPYWIRQGLNLQISKQKKILSLGEEKGSLNGLTETLCIFTLFFSLCRIIEFFPGHGLLSLLTFLPGMVLTDPKLSPLCPIGQACCIIWPGYHHCPAQLNIHADTFIAAMRISLLNKALGIRLFSTLKVFIWKITLFV